MITLIGFPPSPLNPFMWIKASRWSLRSVNRTKPNVLPSFSRMTDKKTTLRLYLTYYENSKTKLLIYHLTILYSNFIIRKNFIRYFLVSEWLFSLLKQPSTFGCFDGRVSRSESFPEFVLRNVWRQVGHPDRILAIRIGFAAVLRTRVVKLKTWRLKTNSIQERKS